MSSLKIGLDIGLSSIKVVALDHHKKPPKLVSLGSIAAPTPGMSSEADLDLEAVANSIKKLLSATKIEEKEIIAALPESKVFTRVIDDLPYLSDSELPSAIKYASEEFIPMSIAEVSLNWQILYRDKENKGRTIAFVVASPKNIVNKYLKVFSMVGLKPKALETEIIAATRALVGNNAFSPTTLVIQMGSTTTDFAVVSQGIILLTRSISTGGAALSRAIAQQFNFENSQAEEYKKVYGLLPDQLEGQVFKTLKPVIDIIFDETKRVLQAFQVKNSSNPIKRIVLSGGGAKLPGIVIYFANGLGLEVQEADPWYAVAKDKSINTQLTQEAPLYSVAAGLALRED
jgi:type IV pilus assembly protein PilM